MNSNQRKGIGLIVGGILVMQLLRFLLGLLGEITGFNFFYELHYLLDYRYSWLKIIIGLVVAGFGVKLFLTQEQTDDDAVNERKIVSAEITNISSDQVNRVSKISLTGGLIGLVAGSPGESLNKRIRLENSKGWEVVQILPNTHSNLLTLIIRVLLLVFTLLIYTTANGYYIVLKRRQ